MDDLELCDEILEMIDELPERAEEFGDSVRETVLSMREGIEKFGKATPNQKAALERMKQGVENWLR